MLNDYKLLVADLVRDDASRLLETEIERSIAAAVLRYSKDRPREKVEDVTPTGANTLPLPASWETDFSELRSLEYPKGTNPPTFIAQDRYGFYRSTTALVIALLDAVAVAANNTRATYTIAHALTEAVDTIPGADREAVACWAAAGLCDQLAAFYSGGTDATIQADSVRQQSKSQEYAARGKSLRKRYTDELGIDDKRNVAAGTVVNLRDESSLGESRLTHPMRRYS